MESPLLKTIQSNLKACSKEKQMDLFSEEKKVERKYPRITDVGPYGVKWRGENIPKLDSMYENDYTAQFGFTCAECGGSGVNTDPVIHKENCKRR